MSKLDTGIIAILGLGVGAFVLSKMGNGEKSKGLQCKINQHVERINGLDVCVDDDKTISCETGFHLEGGICVPELVCPKECSTGYHVESCKCVRDDEEPPKEVIKSLSYNPKSGVDLVNVNFSLSVSGARSQINWDFGDGSPILSGQTNPSHEYFSSTNGSVTVISQDGRSEKKTFSITVTKKDDVKPETKGKITNVGLSTKKGISPLTVNASVSGTRRIQDVWWDFGDGLTGHGQSKQTVYKNKGVYNGSVKVTFDNGDVDIQTFTVTVTELQLEASIKLYHPSPLKTGQQVLYTVNARNTIGSTKVKWNFGDGNGETTEIFNSAKHSYSYGNTFKVTAIITTGNGQSISVSTNLKVILDKIDDVTCQTGYHVENGVCVRDTPVTPPDPPVTPPDTPVTPKQPVTQLFKGEVAGDKNHSYHPTAFSSTYLLVNYRLPSKAKKIKYARIYLKAKADNFGFDGATATVTFNGSTIGTLKWSAFDDNKSRKLDIKVTSKMKLSSYNVAKVTYKHNNNFFGQPLASGFHVVNANLYVEYEY